MKKICMAFIVLCSYSASMRGMEAQEIEDSTGSTQLLGTYLEGLRERLATMTSERDALARERDDANNALTQAAQAFAPAVQQAIQNTQAQAAQDQAQAVQQAIQNTQAQLTHAQGQLAHTQGQLTHTQAQLAQAQAQLHQAQRNAINQEYWNHRHFLEFLIYKKSMNKEQIDHIRRERDRTFRESDYRDRDGGNPNFRC
jgi:chromosome segregation ATPase